MKDNEIEMREIAKAWLLMKLATIENSEVDDMTSEMAARVWEIGELKMSTGIYLIEKILQYIENIELLNYRNIDENAIRRIAQDLGSGPFEEFVKMHWKSSAEKIIKLRRDYKLADTMVEAAWHGEIPSDFWVKIQS